MCGRTGKMRGGESYNSRATEGNLSVTLSYLPNLSNYLPILDVSLRKLISYTLTGLFEKLINLCICIKTYQKIGSKLTKATLRTMIKFLL